jgi:3-deoxy-D-manno-octulosonate 8-phosphate phosphatase KdsC-like HAD superfamily phosphatase
MNTASQSNPNFDVALRIHEQPQVKVQVSMVIERGGGQGAVRMLIEMILAVCSKDATAGGG